MVEDFDSDDTMDALLKEALTEFEECWMRLDKIAGKKHVRVTISSSTPAFKNLTRYLVSQGEGSIRGKGHRGRYTKYFPISLYKRSATLDYFLSWLRRIREFAADLPTITHCA